MNANILLICMIPILACSCSNKEADADMLNAKVKDNVCSIKTIELQKISKDINESNQDASNAAVIEMTLNSAKNSAEIRKIVAEINKITESFKASDKFRYIFDINRLDIESVKSIIEEKCPIEIKSTTNQANEDLQKQEEPLPTNDMTEEEGLAESDGIAAAEVEYAKQQNQQADLARIQAETEAAIAKNEALQVEAKKASMLSTCMTESRTLTTEAGNLVRLSDGEAESYCQCVSRSDLSDLSVKKKNCLNQLL